MYRYVVPEYAHEWRYLGALLKFEQAELDIIFSDYRNDSKECCRILLSQWLEKHDDASWNQLFLAINDISSLSGPTSQGMHMYIAYTAKHLQNKTLWISLKCNSFFQLTFRSWHFLI